MAKRKNLSKKIRFEVFKRDKFTCQYCGKTSPDVVLEVDHIIPVTNGGSNEMLNLITACFDCNRGKGKVELSDNTAIHKQTQQLHELANKNEQLEMLIEWRKELLNFKDKEVNKAADYFGSLTDCSVNEHGKDKLKKWIKDFGIEEILDVIDIAVDKNSDKDTDFIFNQIPKIASVRRKSKSDPQLYYFNYIKKCMKSEYSYINYMGLHELIYQNVFTDEDFEKTKYVFKQSHNWSVFARRMEEVFGCEE